MRSGLAQPARKRRRSHIFTHQNGVAVGRTRRPNRVGRLQFLVFSAPWRLCGRIWVCGGDGAFAPESWVPSARRPYLVFSIRVDSRHSRAVPKRQRTAISTTDFLCGFVPSCEFLAYSYLSAAWQNPGCFQNTLLRVPAPLREDLGWVRRRVRA